jgi:hypothetical protein
MKPNGAMKIPVRFEVNRGGAVKRRRGRLPEDAMVVDRPRPVDLG